MLGVAWQVLLAGTAGAGDAIVINDSAPVAQKPWDFCRTFDQGALYSAPAAPVLQSFSVIGHYQGQFVAADSNHGAETLWENRRWRAGFKAAFCQHLEFFTQASLRTDFDNSAPFLKDFDEISLKWEPSKDFYLILGKQKAKITNEWAESARFIRTFERSLLVNQLMISKLGGLVAGWRPSDKVWLEGGLYGGALTEELLLPSRHGGLAASARAGWNVSRTTAMRVDSFLSDQNPDSKAVSPYACLVSWNTESRFGPWGLMTDVMAGVGGDERAHPDVFGLVLLPSYQMTDRLQAVFRYQYANAGGAEGLNLQKRYERPTVDDGAALRGDNYHAFYLGMNYRLCQDKLKLLAGLEYATMGGHADYQGWTVMSGIRMYY